jgi:polysaccharide biosynthesis/export protein VpsN
MPISRIINFLLTLVVAVIHASCVHPHRNSPAASRTLIPGDNLVIEFGDSDITVWPQKVRDDGTIPLPFNKTVLAATRTASQLEKTIHDIYVPDLLKRVTVKVRTGPPFFFVTGGVKTPGQKDYSGSMTVMRAIRAAGGFSDFTDKQIEIFRGDGQRLKVDGNALLKGNANDIPVYPGDRLHVSRGPFF